MRTDVELLRLEGRLERWIRFGKPVAERVLDARRRIVSFAPGAVFALVRQQAGEHGAAVSRIDILRAVRPGEDFAITPFVSPGAERLLHAQGWPAVRRVLLAIAAVEAQGVDPKDADPEHWRQAHARLAAGEPAPRYDRARHLRWRLAHGRSA